MGLDIHKGKGVDVIGNVHRMPFRDRCFEIGLCTETLEHLQEPFTAIEEIRRVLKVGGKLVLTTRFLYPIHNEPSDFYRYTKFGLLYQIRNWHVEKIEEDSSPILTYAALLEKSYAQTKLSRLVKILLLALIAILKTINIKAKLEHRSGFAPMTAGYCVIAKKEVSD